MIALTHRTCFDTSEWELTPLIQPVLNNMNIYFEARSGASKYASCNAATLKIKGSDVPMSVMTVNKLIGIDGTYVSNLTAGTDGKETTDLKQHFIQALVLSAPCR